MDWYHLALFAHILGVLGLFMALAVELASMAGSRRARTIEAVRVWSSVSKPLSVVFPVTSLLTLCAGLAMTLGVWGWGHAWIDLSLALLILLSIVGATVNGRYAKRIAERAAALGHGTIPPDLRHELYHPMYWTSVISMATLGLGIVFLMVEKPDLLGSVIPLAVALLVGVILGKPLLLALVSSKNCCERRITMAYHLMDTSCTGDGEPAHAPEEIPAEKGSPASLLSNPPCSELSLPLLAAQCLRELDNYRRGELCTETYGLELFRRAIKQSDQEAWAWVQHCFGGVVRGWLRRHPQRAVACRLESEETYVAQAFERFWQATVLNQRLAFSQLSAALQYLRASLNGAILDTLRAYARPREVSLPGPGEPGEPVLAT